ncbi:MAG: methyltransferase domain-containing protein [Candidatus Hermodarchaeota archaeon]
MLGDVYNIKLENNDFDIVISTDVIEHIKYPDKM